MFKLDKKFLEDVGLGSLPEEQRKAFLQYVYSELETRVGENLTESMSDEMLNEFGYFVDKNFEMMKAWFANNLPDYMNFEDFKLFQSNNPDFDEVTLLSEYGATKWLQKNRPDYPQVVAKTLEELKKEIYENKDKILAQ